MFLARRIAARRPRRAAWVDGKRDWAVEDDVAGAISRVADRLDARPADEFGGNPLAGAADVFTRIRATDDLEPIRSMAEGREDLLTEPMRRVLAEPVVAADPVAESAAADLRSAAVRFFRRCPLPIAPVATGPAPSEDMDTPFAALAPCRAVSLIGISALAVPAGAIDGVPISVQLVGLLPEVLWAAGELANR